MPPTPVAPFEAQLPQKYGATICTAVSASRVAFEATNGRVRTTGAAIRARTNEPKPDPKSPGLNLPQVVAVLENVHKIQMDVFIGSRALPWTEYEAKRKTGRPSIIQVGYGPIAASMFDAGRGFRGGHAMAETESDTKDSLADGRARGVWKYDGRLYTRAVIQQAAAALDIGGGRYPAGVVWCAFGADVVPEYRVEVMPLRGKTTRPFRSFVIRNGLIVDTKANRTGGFRARAHLRCVPWPARRSSVYVLELLKPSSRAGLFIPLHWGEPA